ncbi:hypothetical protein N320_05280, partial [Buceros rhinoceros silvestris]
DQVVHVALGLGELHLVHPLARVPVEEGLAPEHGGELLRDALEELLDGRAVADEGDGHLEPPRRDVADGRLDVVGDPLPLLGELGDGEGAVLLAAAGGQRGEARHEEVEAREGHHVDSQLAEVSVELAGEAEGGGDAAHGGRDEVVEV